MTSTSPLLGCSSCPSRSSRSTSSLTSCTHSSTQGSGMPDGPTGAGAQPALTEEPPAQPEREFSVKARTQRELILRRFLQHKLAVGSLVVFLLLIFASFIGQYLWHYKYNVSDFIDV